MNEERSEQYGGDIGWDAFLRRVRQRWPKLTNTDMRALDQIAFAVGNYEGLVGRLRERYSLTEKQAQRETDVFLQAFLGRPKPHRQHGVS